MPCVGKVEILKSHNRHQKIPGQDLHHNGCQHNHQEQAAHEYHSDNHSPDMFPQIRGPSRGQSQRQRSANQNRKKKRSRNLEHNLPQKESAASATPLPPSLPNRTSPPQNRVEEDEPEYAADVQKNERQ